MRYRQMPGFGHEPATNAPYSVAPRGVITLHPHGSAPSALATVFKENQLPGGAGLHFSGPVPYWLGWEDLIAGMAGLGLNRPTPRLELIIPAEAEVATARSPVLPLAHRMPERTHFSSPPGFEYRPATPAGLERRDEAPEGIARRPLNPGRWGQSGLGQFDFLGANLQTLALLGVGGFLVWYFVFRNKKAERRQALSRARKRHVAELAKIKADLA